MPYWAAVCLLFVVLGPLTAGCGTVSPGSMHDARLGAELPVVAGDEDNGGDAHTAADAPSREDLEAAPVLVQARGPEPPGLEPPDEFAEPYDPWEPFNETMFEFNLRLDRWVLKPTARAYRVIIPDPLQGAIANGFNNLGVVPRIVNNLLQGKFAGAGRELLRFVLNSTAGIGGLFDPAKDYWGIQPSDEDFGQTLGVWGVGPGPYLVLPVLPPLTVRDGVGKGVDMFLDPLAYFDLLPLIPHRLALTAGEKVNERALNYDLFQGVEETTLDLYSSVRHFYLNKRENDIKK